MEAQLNRQPGETGNGHPGETGNFIDNRGLGRRQNSAGSSGSSNASGYKRRDNRNKNGFLQRTIDAEQRKYALTNIYDKGMLQKFKSQRARDNFNNWVRANIAQIDPSHQFYCDECSQVDYYACDCRIAPHVEQPADESDAAVLFEISARASEPVEAESWGQWYRRLLTVFNKPHFSPGSDHNPDLCGISNQHIPTGQLFNSDLYNYLRLHRSVDYIVDGQFKRGVALAHMRALALRYIDEREISVTERSSPTFVNTFWATIQKAVDDGVHDMLTAQKTEHRNWGLNFIWSVFRRAGELVKANPYKVIYAAAVALGCLSPTLRRKLLSVPIRLYMWVLAKVYRTNWDILQSGSLQALGLAQEQLTYTASALKEPISAGVSQILSSGTQQSSLCKDAITTSLSHCRNVISNKLPSLSSVSTGIQETAKSAAVIGTNKCAGWTPPSLINHAPLMNNMWNKIVVALQAGTNG